MPKRHELILLALMATLAGCGSSSSSGSRTTSAGAVNPNQHETLPPGDIPDTVAYVPFTVPGTGVRVSAPEGFSRSGRGGTVTFTDKLNRILVFQAPASSPVTAASARRIEVPKLASSVNRFKLQSISTVSRPAGPAVRIAYLGDSSPNPVTGKVGTLAFERYEFFHGGRQVVLLLSSPYGSDNVDPWNKVTSSLRFSR